MPFCPFFCPYINNMEDDDDAFRSPDPPPFFNPPGQGPGKGPGFGPPSGPPAGGHGGPPGPPPSKTPAFKATGAGPSVKAVEPGAIRPCRYQFVYIWPTYGRPFWAWLTFVGRRSVAGYRWNGYSWRYFGMDLRQIESFECF